MIIKAISQSENDQSMISRNLTTQTSRKVFNGQEIRPKIEWLEIKDEWLSIYSKRREIKNKKALGTVLMVHGYYSHKNLENVQNFEKHRSKYLFLKFF